MRRVLSKDELVYGNAEDLAPLTAKLSIREQIFKETVAYVNMPNTYVPDDPTYAEECVSFATIAKTMTKLTEDGKLLKQLLHEGRGTLIPPNTYLTIRYKAFVEFNYEPFDSTFKRRKPFYYHKGVDSTVIGLDFALKGMKVGEKARILMTHEYAYGKKGYLSLVPPYASVLYEVEILNSVGCQPYERFSKAQLSDINEIYNHCLLQSSQADKFFKQKRYKLALHEYNRLKSSLEGCVLKNAKERDKQLKFVIHILVNLVVTHTKLEQWKLACFNANKVMRLCSNSSYEIPVRVYFNKARSLIALGDYYTAEKLLMQVRKRRPDDCEETKQEFAKLYKKRRESRGEPEPIIETPKHEENKPKVVRKEIEFDLVRYLEAPMEELIFIDTDDLDD